MVSYLYPTTERGKFKSIGPGRAGMDYFIDQNPDEPLSNEDLAGPDAMYNFNETDDEPDLDKQVELSAAELTPLAPISDATHLLQRQYTDLTTSLVPEVLDLTPKTWRDILQRAYSIAQRVVTEPDFDYFDPNNAADIARRLADYYPQDHKS